MDVFTFLDIAVQFLFLLFHSQMILVSGLLTLATSFYLYSTEGGMIVWIDLVIGWKIINE